MRKKALDLGVRKTAYCEVKDLGDSTHEVRRADDFCGHVSEQASRSKLAHANMPTLVRLSHAVVRVPQARWLRTRFAHETRSQRP